MILVSRLHSGRKVGYASQQRRLRWNRHALPRYVHRCPDPCIAPLVNVIVDEAGMTSERGPSPGGLQVGLPVRGGHKSTFKKGGAC